MRIATIERVCRIQKIPNTLLVYVFTTNDNYSICHSNEFLQNDRVVYIHKGTYLPDAYNCDKYTRKGFVKGTSIQGHYSNGVIVEMPEELQKYPIGHEVSYRMGITKYRGDGPKNHPNIIQSFRNNYHEYLVNKNLFAKEPEYKQRSDYYVHEDVPEHEESCNPGELDLIGTTMMILWLMTPVYLYTRFF